MTGIMGVITTTLLSLLLAAAGTGPVPSEPAKASTAEAADGSSAPAAPIPPLPVVREARYRMSAAVRPLLIFWIHAGNVGGAHVLWRGDGSGRRGFDLLIGSDPKRAPRRINRWGFEREQEDERGATLFGVMRKTDEESLDEARAELRQEGRSGFPFKAIRSRVENGEVRSENTVWRAPRDYAYRDIGELLALVAGPPQHPPNVREARLPAGTKPGFLFALSDVVDEAVSAAIAPGTPRRLLSGLTRTFTFNASLYDLHLRSSTWLDSASYEGRRYERLLRLDFEHFNREKGTRERFMLVCATDGPLARVPVYVEYQPKWWFKAEGVLDDSETFPVVP